MEVEPEKAATCELIGLTGIIIQIVLGALSFSILIYKRSQERPRRPWKIWSLDTSKQLTSQMFAHFINLFISMQLSSQLENDACIWYFTTNVFDNTIGVFLCVGVLTLIETQLFQPRPNWWRFKSGNYYHELDHYQENDFPSPGIQKESTISSISPPSLDNS